MSQGADPVGGVGIVAGSQAALQEIGSLLAGQGVALSRTIGPDDGLDLAAGLGALQHHAETELLILASDQAPPETVEALLVQVRASDKPTVACLLGVNPRLVWQSGAIPARRLDEAARRAAAWVQGLDQALISSQLQEEDDALAAQARGLRSALQGRGRQVAALLSARTFCQEARLMLAELAPGIVLSCLEPGADQPALLRAALGAPETAIVLLNVDALEPLLTAQALAHALDSAGGSGPLAIVRLCCPPSQAVTRAAAVLTAAGAVVAPSNAAAARLAALIVRA